MKTPILISMRFNSHILKKSTLMEILIPFDWLIYWPRILSHESPHLQTQLLTKDSRPTLFSLFSHISFSYSTFLGSPYRISLLYLLSFPSHLYLVVIKQQQRFITHKPNQSNIFTIYSEKRWTLVYCFFLLMI